MYIFRLLKLSLLTLQMLFPYDLFIKFYNSDKVDLQPRGLTNCGNRYKPSACPQILTIPLTLTFLVGSNF